MICRENARWRRVRRGAPRPLLAAALLLAAAPAAGMAAEVTPEARQAVLAAAGALCPDGVEAPEVLELRLPGYLLSDVEETGPPEGWLRREIRLVNGEADLALLVTALRPGGILRRLVIESRALSGDRPLLLAMTGGDCDLQLARALSYHGKTASELLLLAPDLVTVVGREALDPPVPEALPEGPPPGGIDAGGVIVAHVDSGVNYLLPEIAGRLARDAAGRSLGYDFWDMDLRPFDGDTGRSPFFPIRHGTEVASLLLAEAPAARLLPFRYPRPDMSRMAAAVTAAAEAGAAIMMLPLGSTRQDDWLAFEAAARAQPQMLFIASAGNDGRDIDARTAAEGRTGGRPLYPAGLDLDNMIVVTSSDLAGVPAPGSNWGAVSVDLLVPAEHRRVTGFDGKPTEGSGSSFAVPRVAALAARLKAAHPDWQAAELKRAIFARAVAPPVEGTVAVGWIPDPGD
ncbi:S8 family serine peptidase [Pelagibius marinus]|uniref:S8 family serine peptidase n=1 Tax=Pelagibius marinus TaxID=2762760 RepID=UPI0018724774|nr:S8 family serine peptidase [Pelagibius marinus]